MSLNKRARKKSTRTSPVLSCWAPVGERGGPIPMFAVQFGPLHIERRVIGRTRNLHVRDHEPFMHRAVGVKSRGAPEELPPTKAGQTASFVGEVEWKTASRHDGRDGGGFEPDTF